MSKEYMQAYYLKNKEKYQTKYNKPHYCIHCESAMKMKHRLRHEKTKKHQANKSPHESKPRNEFADLKQQVKLLMMAVHQLEGRE
jgi:hypothetical protein